VATNSTHPDFIGESVLPMDSNNSTPQNSQPQSSESTKQKRIYMQLGILESRADFAKQFLQAMRDEGLL
jgi:hypothetical protein